jgi:hypothetical protein
MVGTTFRKELEERFPNIQERKAHIAKLLLERIKNPPGLGQVIIPTTHELRVYHTELHDKILAAAKSKQF